MLIQINIIDCVRYLRRRSRQCSGENHVCDSGIHVEGYIESIVDFVSSDCSATSFNKSMVREGIQIWTGAALYSCHLSKCSQMASFSL